MLEFHVLAENFETIPPLAENFPIWQHWEPPEDKEASYN